MGGYFLDTNLFVLLVVGSESRDLISKHRRLEHYSDEDYDILLEVLRDADQLFVTPNTLTETSNLVSQHREPERSLLMRRLQYFIHVSEEIVVASVLMPHPTPSTRSWDLPMPPCLKLATDRHSVA